MNKNPVPGWNVVVAMIGILAAHAVHGAVGNTPGSISVTQDGASSFSVPIMAPPGTHGMTPSLSLGYSSSAGSGWIGQGWFIGGLSSVQRCPKTWAQDAGAPRNVQLDLYDRYCLDGNRLRAVSGAHGIGGTEYRTELETFTRVLSRGEAGSGPAYFTAEMKNGLIYEFGKTDDSRIESQGQATVRTWAVNAIRDRDDNAILFNYTDDATTGSYRLDNVQYTTNLSQGLSAAYKIAFFYENQPSTEIDSGYWAGRIIRDTVRLTRVDVTYNGGLVRRYHVTYEPSLSSTSKSRVQSLQECAGSSGTDCFAATTFTYWNGTAGMAGQISTGVGAQTSRWLTDVNGDGREDVVYSSGTSGSSNWMVMFASGGGYAAPVNTGITNTNYTQAIKIDYNADGYGDMLVPYSGGTWWVLQGSASGFQSPGNTGIPVTTTGHGLNARALDVNGDGLQDLVWADLVGFAGGDTIRYRLREWGGTFSSNVNTLVEPMGVDSSIPSPVWGVENNVRTREPDFNGDGRDDFLYRRTDRVFIDGPNIWQNTYYTAAASPGAGGSIYESSSPSVTSTYGDFNGDGFTDIIYLTSATTSRMRFGTGAGFSGDTFAPHNSQGTLVAYDWDGDGYDDVLSRDTSGSWTVARSNGLTFASQVATGISSGESFFVTDINGDGLQDLGYSSGGIWHYRLHSGVLPDLLDSVTDGFGNVTSFAYTSIAQGSYTKYTGASYPEQEYGGPLNVVDTVTAPNGIGGTYTQSYWYYGARTDLQGRGFEGFAARRVHDSRNGLYAYEHFHQQFPFTGLSRQSDLYQPNNTTLISQVGRTWTSHTYNAGTEARLFPYVGNSTHRRYEVGGTYNGALVSTTTTVNQLHAATGTIYDQTATTTEASSANGVLANTSYVSRTHLPTAYLTNATATWCISRPGQHEAINSHGDFGGTQLTRTTEIGWDLTKCRPSTVIAEPSNSLLQVTRSLGYDGFGNINSDAITGIDMLVRATTYNWGTTGQFIAWTQNAEEHVTNFTWDYRFGAPSTLTDPNGLVTSWQYDDFGRRNRETRPDDTYTLWSITLASGSNCDPRARYHVYEAPYTKYGTLIAQHYTFLDSFDRPINEYRTAFASGAFDTVVRGYDALGRVAQESIPYGSAGCQVHSVESPTKYEYDLLGRPTKISRPVSDSDPTQQETSLYYEGLKTRVEDALGKQTAKTANVLGAMVRSTDHSGYTQGFYYDAFGNVVLVNDHLSNTLQTNAYNVRGMLTSQTDMDRGAWTFHPNALGELDWLTDANGVTTTFDYDLLGRLTSRVAPDSGHDVTITWKWGDSAADRNIGQPASVHIGGSTVTDNQETYVFDAQGRPKQTVYTASGVDYFLDRTYNDATGLLETLTYPQSIAGYRLKLQYEYQDGRLWQVKDYNAPSTVFWQANVADARGNVIDEQYGNNVRTIRGYDQVTGLLDYIQSGPSGDGSLQNLSYTWDRIGNLVERQDVRQSLTEHFYYDELHRLDYSSLNGSENLDLSYDALGNIQSKTGVGTYTYHLTKKHAVASTSSPARTFAYDNNGNQITRNGLGVSWYPFHLPKQINAAGNNTSTFNYNGNGGRWNQVALHDGVTETTTYIGGVMDIVVRGGVTSYRHYIAGGTGTIAEHIRDTAGLSTTRYLTKDHLGSVDTITSSTGSVIVRLSQGAYGERRNEAGWSGAVPAADKTNIAANTRRGFTEHDMLDNVGLVHMNGRVFDPVVGRFISADPFIDGAGNTQGWNRYSYVANNPLSLADPTGFAGTALYYRMGSPLGTAGLWGAGGFTRQILDGTTSSAGTGANSFQCTQSEPPRNNPAQRGPVQNPLDLPGVTVIASGFGEIGLASQLTLARLLEIESDAPSSSDKEPIEEVVVPGRMSVEEYGVHTRQHIAELDALLAMGNGTTPYVDTYTTADGIEEVLTIASILPPIRFARVGARVIGRFNRATRNIDGIRAGESSLLKHLPDQGSPQPNWSQNAGVLRREMKKGVPIRDAAVDPKTGELMDYPGSFLNAERNLLRDRGWTYDPSTTLWSPP